MAKAKQGSSKGAGRSPQRKVSGAAARSRTLKQVREQAAGTTFKSRGAITKMTRADGTTRNIRTPAKNAATQGQRNRTERIVSKKIGGRAIWTKNGRNVTPDQFIRDHARANGKKGVEKPPQKAVLSSKNKGGEPHVTIYHADGTRSRVNLTWAQFREWDRTLKDMGGESKLMKRSVP